MKKIGVWYGCEWKASQILLGNHFALVKDHIEMLQNLVTSFRRAREGTESECSKQQTDRVRRAV